LIALQEVVNDQAGNPEREQARYLANALGIQYYRFEQARRWRGNPYGNAVLSRYPILSCRNFDLSWKKQEPRACLRVDVKVSPHRALHIFNVHLGTALWERYAQAEILVSADLLNDPRLKAPRVLLGDFNDWTRGPTSRLLAKHLVSADLKRHLQRRRTYPGIFPFVHLDHIYFDHSLHLESLRLHRSKAALIASDHLPLVADFRWTATPLETDESMSHGLVVSDPVVPEVEFVEQNG
jgi:endonuclease/exonuclease/phosphatase family metal-dependent hydrolase